MRLVINKFFFLFFVFLLSKAQGQVINAIQYELTGKFVKQVELEKITEYLIFDSKKSFYFNSSFEENKSVLEAIKPFDSKKGNLRVINYFDSENEIYEVLKSPITGRSYVSFDNYNLQWEMIGNSYKNILGYTCKLAKTHFRGRQYFAYFTPDIPFGIGPWKLKGLPGLILEAYDANEDYHYTVTAINLNIDGSFPEEMLDFVAKNKEQKVHYKVFINEQSVYFEKLKSKVISNLPKGSTLKEAQNPRKEMREVMFEWEEAKIP